MNVFRRDGGFELALTYGPSVDWVKNVMAAGGARLLYRAGPRLPDPPSRTPSPWFGAVRLILSLLRVDTFLFLDDQR